MKTAQKHLKALLETATALGAKRPKNNVLTIPVEMSFDVRTWGEFATIAATTGKPIGAVIAECVSGDQMCEHLNGI